MSNNKRKFLTSIAAIIAGMSIQAQAGTDLNESVKKINIGDKLTAQSTSYDDNDFILEPSTNKSLKSAAHRSHSSHSSHRSHQSHQSHYSSYQQSYPLSPTSPEQSNEKNDYQNSQDKPTDVWK